MLPLTHSSLFHTSCIAKNVTRCNHRLSASLENPNKMLASDKEARSRPDLAILQAATHVREPARYCGLGVTIGEIEVVASPGSAETKRRRCVGRSEE